MSTATFQLRVQRDRFASHALGAIAARLPRQLRSLVERSSSVAARPNAAESASSEAGEVREMARAYQRSDPGFAADLFAAAARHEGLYAD